VKAGAKLGAYEVIAKLGQGGMGEVYRATDVNLKREVVGFAFRELPEMASLRQDPRAQPIFAQADALRTAVRR
jgi:hypothetical protein